MVDVEDAEDVEHTIEKAVSDELDERTSKLNSIAVTSHNLTVRLNSEESDMEELVEYANETIREREKHALIGEYEVLEEQDMMSMFLGGHE